MTFKRATPPYPPDVQHLIDQGAIGIARDRLINTHVVWGAWGTPAWKSPSQRRTEYDELVSAGKAPPLPEYSGDMPASDEGLMPIRGVSWWAENHGG